MRPATGALGALLAFGLTTTVRTAAAQTPAVAGVVLEDATGRPAPGAAVRLTGAGGARTAASDSAGRFRVDGLAPGVYAIEVRRLGFAPARRRVRLPAAGDADVVVRLARAAVTLREVTVSAAGGAREAFRPALALEGAALDRRLGGSVAATLAGEPGVVQRYNGPAAAQPVIRGLSGDRVLVLEDGQRVGDVATTAADHAVTVDPLTAERLEVVRGPAGLLFGSTTVGGVVNVVRDEVPRALPERASLALSAQGESVNAGLTAGGVGRARLGPVAVRADYTGRTGNDTRTPRGPLPYTDLDGSSAGAGASLIGRQGHVGAAVRDVRTFYGVPGTFAGRTIPGAHEGGIYVDLHRVTGRAAGELRRDRGRLASVSADASYAWFEQREVERGGFTGTRFGQLLGTATLVARYRDGAPNEASTAMPNGTPGGGRRPRVPGAGAVGLWALGRDWAAAGSYTGTRPATQAAWAAFAYHEVALGRVRAQAGARYDWTRLTPRDTTSSRIGNNTLLTGIGRRAFRAVTGSAAALVDLAPGWTAGATVARSFRAPAVEELYSNGPHLAAYAYEVGNPGLRPEVGVGGDLFVRVRRPALTVDASVFATRVADYVRYTPLVDPAAGGPLLDYRLRRYPVYQAAQGDAGFVGAEGKAEWRPGAGWTLESVAQAVRGTDRVTGAPLPFMPPLQGRLGARRDGSRAFAGLGVDWAARQGRVPRFPGIAGAPAAGALLPGEFLPTVGRVLVDATAGVRLRRGGRPHALTLHVENLLDRPWQDALSRVKTVAPQPGRNVRLLCRIEL